MTIVPDTKNWTWVLERRCPECGFDAAEVGYREVPGLVRDNAQAWAVRLQLPDVHERPSASTWSPLEYGAHVRDVLDVFGARLLLMLTEDAPTFANWDQDQTAIEERYAEQDPAVVSAQLIAAAQRSAASFERVADHALTRTGLRSDGSAFTIDSLARYFVHDLVHHLHDVRTTPV